MPPDPTVGAPVLDPTGERDGENHREQSMNGVPVPTLRRKVSALSMILDNLLR
jgi:hypothetical protein